MAPTVALALVDMELPGAQDGTLLRALKREQPGLRVLLMSGRPRSDLQRFLQTGADAVLEKPFRLGELDQSLDVALSLARLMARFDRPRLNLLNLLARFSSSAQWCGRRCGRLS